MIDLRVQIVEQPLELWASYKEVLVVADDNLHQ